MTSHREARITSTVKHFDTFHPIRPILSTAPPRMTFMRRNRDTAATAVVNARAEP